MCSLTKSQDKGLCVDLYLIWPKRRNTRGGTLRFWWMKTLRKGGCARSAKKTIFLRNLHSQMVFFWWWWKSWFGMVRSGLMQLEQKRCRDWGSGVLFWCVCGKPTRLGLRWSEVAWCGLGRKRCRDWGSGVLWDCKKPADQDLVDSIARSEGQSQRQRVH